VFFAFFGALLLLLLLLLLGGDLLPTDETAQAKHGRNPVPQKFPGNFLEISPQAPQLA